LCESVDSTVGLLIIWLKILLAILEINNLLNLFTDHLYWRFINIILNNFSFREDLIRDISSESLHFSSMRDMKVRNISYIQSLCEFQIVQMFIYSKTILFDLWLKRDPKVSNSFHSEFDWDKCLFSKDINAYVFCDFRIICKVYQTRSVQNNETLFNKSFL
jgi:hypothetical protein